MLDQILFEITMALRGAVALPQAYILAEGSAILGAWYTLAVVIIGLGCLFKIFRKWLVSGGVILFLIGMIGSELLKALSFPYGKENAALVIRLGQRLMSRDTLPESFTQQFGGSTSIFLSAPLAPGGHQYVALNRLPCVGPGPWEVASRIGDDLNSVFPIIASGQGGKEVRERNLFLLGILPMAGRNPVFSSNLHGHYFTLTTAPEHWLQGTANHGIVRDGSGDLWMFQVGFGPKNEDAYKHLLAYPLAHPMWNQMAENTAKRFRGACSTSPTSSSNAGASASIPPGTLPQIGVTPSSPAPVPATSAGSSAYRRTIEWSFSDGNEGWTIEDGSLAAVSSGVLWANIQGGSFRLISPFIDRSPLSGHINMEIGLAAKCTGPIRIYVADEPGGKLLAKELVAVPSYACDRCDKPKFFKYKAKLPAPVKRLAVAPCAVMYSNPITSVAGLDFVKLSW